MGNAIPCSQFQKYIQISSEPTSLGNISALQRATSFDPP